MMEKYLNVIKKNEIETIQGIRIIHSNEHLPSFGGLRFNNSTNYEDLETAAELNTLKARVKQIKSNNVYIK